MSSIQLVELLLAGVGLSILNVAYVFQIIKLYNSKHTIGINKTAYFYNFIGRWGFVAYGTLVSGTIGLVILVGQGFVALMTIPIIYYGWRNQGTEGHYIKTDFRTDLFILRISLMVITAAMIIVGLLMREEVGAIHLELKGAAKRWIPFGVSFVFTLFTGFSFFPQTMQTIKTRKTHSISIMMLIMFVVGNGLLIIGLIVSSIERADVVSYIAPIILGTTSTVLMFITMIIKLRNIRLKKISEKNKA